MIAETDIAIGKMSPVKSNAEIKGSFLWWETFSLGIRTLAAQQKHKNVQVFHKQFTVDT